MWIWASSCRDLGAPVTQHLWENCVPGAFEELVLVFRCRLRILASPGHIFYFHDSSWFGTKQGENELLFLCHAEGSSYFCIYQELRGRFLCAGPAGYFFIFYLCFWTIFNVKIFKGMVNHYLPGWQHLRVSGYQPSGQTPLLISA